MPARYVIGKDGTILYSEVNPDYTHRPEPVDMIPVLQRAAAEKSDSGQQSATLSRRAISRGG
jgi:hypothetical protein